EWTDAGVEGARRYVDRLWRLYNKHTDILKKDAPETEVDEALLKLRRKTHQTIQQVTEMLEKCHMNSAVAKIRELTNALEPIEPKDDASRFVLKEGLGVALKLLNPMMPHLTEELWKLSESSETLASQGYW